MSRLPVISGRECVKVLEKAGFSWQRSGGQSLHLAPSCPFAQVVVPDHKVLDRGTLRAIMRQSGLSVAEFRRHV